MNNIQISLQNWKRMLILTEDVDCTDSVIRKKIQRLNANAERALAFYSPQRGFSLFLDTPPEKSSDMSEEYRRIFALAQA